jgi:hypothetical protein
MANDETTSSKGSLADSYHCPDCYRIHSSDDGPLRDYLTCVRGEDDPSVQETVLVIADLCRRALARGDS